MDERRRLELTQQLVEDHHGRVYRYAWLLSGCKSTAEDISQEVFIRAFNSVHQLRSIETAGSWLLAITRNEVARWCGKRTARHELTHDPAEPYEAETDLERHEWVHRAVGQLSDEFRQVVLMFYFEQKSYHEIASELGLPMGTVMSRLNRARGHLKTSLLSLAEPTSTQPNPRSSGVKEAS